MSERRHLVLTAVGPDRPGLVNQISSLIHEAGANLEDSRMAILGGEFAVLLLVSGSAAAMDAVKACGTRIESELGLVCVLKETTTLTTPIDFIPYRLRVTGVDRPGIVQAITSILAGRGINLAALESRVTYAALSGTPMFTLDAALQLPSRLDLAGLRGELGARCDAENLDFVLEGAG